MALVKQYPMRIIQIVRAKLQLSTLIVLELKFLQKVKPLIRRFFLQKILELQLKTKPNERGTNCKRYRVFGRLDIKAPGLCTKDYF